MFSKIKSLINYFERPNPKRNWEVTLYISSGYGELCYRKPRGKPPFLYETCIGPISIKEWSNWRSCCGKAFKLGIPVVWDNTHQLMCEPTLRYHLKKEIITWFKNNFLFDDLALPDGEKQGEESLEYSMKVVYPGSLLWQHLLSLHLV